jgi:F0F1-type ATP synthase membrane subunit b/b'
VIPQYLEDALRRAAKDVADARKALEEARNNLANARKKAAKYDPRYPRPDAQRRADQPSKKEERED